MISQTWDFCLGFVNLIKFVKLISRLTESHWQNTTPVWQPIISGSCIKPFFSVSVFFQTLTIHRTTGEGRGPSFIRLHHFPPLTTLTFHVERPWHISNRTTCICQTATQLHLLPYWITIWLIDDAMLVSLFTWWFDSRFLLPQFGTVHRWIWIHID